MTGSTGSFVSGGTCNLAFEIAVPFVAVGGLELGGRFSVVVAVYLMPECLEYSAEFVFDGCDPSSPPYLCKWSS